MRILPRLLMLALLPLAACDGGTLPATDAIHGEWAAPMTLFRGTGDIDRAEHRYLFRPDGTYQSTILGWDRAGIGWRVVYRGESTGRYRLDEAGVAMSVQRVRWRDAETSGWQDEFVADQESLGPPIRYTVERGRLILHLGPTQGEHGEPVPAEARIYTRRR
ncbi:MAG: hypothetical protein KY467_09615 [Gemmatimonadetes bacterium]|nr:hypothetical protein [Gemmatimonadota bacterium]